MFLELYFKLFVAGIKKCYFTFYILNLYPASSLLTLIIFITKKQFLRYIPSERLPFCGGVEIMST